MKKKVIIGIVAVVAIIGVVAALRMNKDGEKNPGVKFPWEEVVEQDETKSQTEMYKADLIEKADHYVLNVQTNLITDNFVFSYDTKDFTLDTSSVLFDKAVINNSSEKENFKRISLKLDSNQVYQFNFIKKNDVEMKLGDNLILD